jgi:hypothetical protein
MAASSGAGKAESLFEGAENVHAGGYVDQERGGQRGNVVWENCGSSSTHWTAILAERFWPGPGEMVEFRVNFTASLPVGSSHWFAVGAAVRWECDGLDHGLDADFEHSAAGGIRKLAINDARTCARHSFNGACDRVRDVQSENIEEGDTVVCRLSYPNAGQVGIFCTTVLPLGQEEVPEGKEFVISSDLPPEWVPWIKVAGAEVTVVDCFHRSIVGSLTKSASKK